MPIQAVAGTTQILGLQPYPIRARRQFNKPFIAINILTLPARFQKRTEDDYWFRFPLFLLLLLFDETKTVREEEITGGASDLSRQGESPLAIG